MEFGNDVQVDDVSSTESIEQPIEDTQSQGEPQVTQNDPELDVPESNEVDQVTDDSVDGPGEDNAPEKAFAKRLSHEREKLEQQYTPYMDILQAEAQKYDMSVDEYVQALKEQEEEAKFYEENEDLVDKGLSNEDIEAIRRGKEVLAEERRLDNLQPQIDRLLEVFPDVQGKDIPDSVLKNAFDNNIPLDIAYKAHLYENQGNVRQQVQNEMVNNLNKKNNAPGSINSSSVNANTKYSEMKTEDFESLIAKVMAGGS